jgi:hypothetical protein
MISINLEKAKTFAAIRRRERTKELVPDNLIMKQYPVQILLKLNLIVKQFVTNMQVFKMILIQQVYPCIAQNN